MRALHADLTTAQTAKTATPYLEIKFEKGRGGASYTYKTIDSPNKIKAIRHIEEPYNSYAILVLDNYDRALPDLFGYYCTIGYGYNTASGDKKSDAAPLWVKKQFHTSKMGSLDNVIYMEGAWNLLSEMRDIASLLGATSPPYYEIDYSATSYTIYDIIKQIFNVAGFGLFALGTHDDSIVDTLQPDYVVNQVGFESAAEDVYRLLNMTKTFCRIEAPTAVAVSGPYTIASSTAANPVGQVSKRSPFFGAGLYWQFYTDGTDLVYETSSDGETWSGSATTIGGCTHGNYFDIYYDAVNNKVYYVRLDDTAGAIYFRKGTPGTDGTITWSAVEQTVIDVGGGMLSIPYVAVDTDQYPWVGYRDATSGTYDAYITKSSTNDGTWSDDTNFPYALESGNNGTWRVIPIPLSNGEVYVIWGTSSDDATIDGKLWDGSWGSAESVATSIDIGMSAVGKGNDVHIVYTVSGVDIKYKKRTYGIGWGSAETIDTSLSAPEPALTNIETTQELACFWVDTADRTALRYSVRTGDTWGTVATLCSDTYIRETSISVASKVYSNIVIVSYGENQNSPYDVKCAKLQPPLNASFRIVYPAGYSSYDYTYTSDKPATTDHQFREFDWRDQPRLPTKVYVLANQDADGGWDSVVIGSYDYGMSNNNEYPDIVEYYVAATLTLQADANNRATAIAYRRHMESDLGRVIVPHNCGQELYDWIKIRDKRGTTTYTDYPPTRWGNLAVVGSLTHIYDPVNGRYDLEITINGIASAPPVGEVFRKTVEEIETEIETKIEKDIVEKEIPEAVRVAMETGITPWPGVISREQWIERGLAEYTGKTFQEAIERAGGVEAAREQMIEAVKEAGLGHLIQPTPEKKERRPSDSGGFLKSITEKFRSLGYWNE